MASKLTEEQKNELSAAFMKLDTDNSGYIDTKEMLVLLRQFGGNPTEKEAQEMIADADKNGNGTMDLEEFIGQMAKNLKPQNEEEAEMREAFKKFDKDGSGEISAVELKHMLTQLGEPMTDEEANEMLKLADVDNNGVINYEEFCKVMTQ